MSGKIQGLLSYIVAFIILLVALSYISPDIFQLIVKPFNDNIQLFMLLFFLWIVLSFSKKK